MIVFFSFTFCFQMAGISVVGRNYYGVFPLRGKLLNVREANHKQIMDNAEIQNIKLILGLQHGKEYDSTKGLRYGSLMIMTDQVHLKFLRSCHGCLFLTWGQKNTEFFLMFEGSWWFPHKRAAHQLHSQLLAFSPENTVFYGGVHYTHC